MRRVHVRAARADTLIEESTLMDSRMIRAIGDDEAQGPAALERLLAMVIVVLLVVMVAGTVGHGVLTLMGGLSVQMPGGR